MNRWLVWRVDALVMCDVEIIVAPTSRAAVEAFVRTRAVAEWPSTALVRVEPESGHVSHVGAEDWEIN